MNEDPEKTMTLSTTSRSLLAVLTLVALAPSGAEAQRRGRAEQAAPTAGWAPISIGLHGGYDTNSQGAMLGAQIRAPIVRSGKIELMPSGSVTFLTGLREYQFSFDALYVPGGQSGGLYVGGGLAARNSIYPDGLDRQTKVGGGVVLGLRSGAGAPLQTQLEVRQAYLDAVLRPTAFTIGVNFPLWGGGR